MNNNKGLKSLLLFMMVGLLMVGCSTNEATDPDDPIFDDTEDNDVVKDLRFDLTLTVDASDGVAINSDILELITIGEECQIIHFLHFQVLLKILG
jgi:hypothetical protein